MRGVRFAGPTWIRLPTMQTRTHRLTIALVAASALALSTGMTRARGAEGQTPAAGVFPFRAQEIAQDFGVGYAVVSGDVNGDGQTDILAINAHRPRVVPRADLAEGRDPRHRGDHRRQRDARTARHRRRRPARHRARRRLDAPEHRHAAVGPPERARRHAGVGSLSDLRGTDAAPDPVGGCRRRSPARVDRRAAAREGSEGAGLGWAERTAARLQAAGESARPTRGRWTWRAKPTTSSTTSFRSTSTTIRRTRS